MFVLQSMSSEWPPRAVSLPVVLSFVLVAVVLLLILVTSKLFLQPKLTREDIINEVYVPHNKFAQLFTRYAGMSFTKFVNELRLEYAAQLLLDCPDYTIEAIGEACGMPIAQTFYRNFSDKFGVTPSDFRILSQKNAEKRHKKDNLWKRFSFFLSENSV